MNSPTLSELVRLQERQAPRPWTPGTGTLIHTPDSDKPDHEYTEQEKIDRRDFIIAARNFDFASLQTQYEAMRERLEAAEACINDCDAGYDFPNDVGNAVDSYRAKYPKSAALDTKARGDGK